MLFFDPQLLMLYAYFCFALNIQYVVRKLLLFLSLLFREEFITYSRWYKFWTYYNHHT
jgi:hypothetical protein